MLRNVMRWMRTAVLWTSVLSSATCCLAMDRQTLRFQRVLTGRHDGARTAAMQSLPTDFQSRIDALPVVVKALEQLADDPRFQRAAERDQPDLPGGVQLMIDFVGSVDRPEATKTLVALLNCGRQSWAMAAIETLCSRRRHAALTAIVAQIDSPWFKSSYGFRFVLARGLKDMDHPQAWDALAVLYDRVDGQLAYRLREEFFTVTAEAFEGDQDHFQTWRGLVGLAPPELGDEVKSGGKEGGLAKAAQLLAERRGGENIALPKKSGLAPSMSAAAYSQRKLTKPSHYYGIQIYAKRLLFVLDRSDSMDTVVSGLSRIGRAKRELVTAIKGLDEQCQFSILVFDNDVRAWREELVPATEDNKLEAIRYVEYLSAGSTTNTYAALRHALAFDDQLEAVFVLTDGAPTSGPIVNPKAILLDILRRNERRNLTINTIAIAVEPEMVSFLQRLAKPSNGEFRRVN